MSEVVGIARRQRDGLPHSRLAVKGTRVGVGVAQESLSNNRLKLTVRGRSSAAWRPISRTAAYPGRYADSQRMVTIRRGTQEDAVAICAVHTSAIRQICSSAYAERDIEAWAGALTSGSYRDPLATQVVLVAVDDGTVVGFGQLKPESGQVEAVYVSPGHTGQGVGGMLLRALEAEARAAGLRRVALAATLNAVPFYASAGYQATGTGKHRLPNGAEIGCVPMVKELSQE